jgi:hypothetical protein
VAGLLINEGIFGAATDALEACDRERRLSVGKPPTLLVYRISVPMRIRCAGPKRISAIYGWC